MWKICVLVLFASVFLHEAFSSTETAPVFMWSNTKAFTGQNIQEINVISARSLSKFTQTESPISKYLTKIETEVIVLFVEPFLSSEQIPLLAQAYSETPNGGAFSNIKKLVETSRSSLVIPYTTAASIGSEMIRSLIAALPTEGSVYNVVENLKTDVDSNQFTVSELMEKLGNPNWTPLKNGVTDLIVVYFNAPSIVSNYDDSAARAQYEKDDHTVGAITEALANIDYLAIFTSDISAFQFESYSQRSSYNGPHIKAFEQKFSQDYNTLYYTNWPDGIIQALLVMTPFVGILFLGICCTFCIQSELKFDAEKNFLKKHK